MKDFKSFLNDDKNKTGRPSGNIESAINLANTLSKNLNGKNERQILSTILAEAERGKRAGTLSDNDLDLFYAALAPNLDDAKKRKLAEIIERLKKI